MKLALLLVPFLFMTPPAQAQSTCAATFVSSSVTELAATLQAEQLAGTKVLAVSDDFDGFVVPSGGGACAPVAAFNALQIFRAQNGFTDRLSPDRTVRTSYTQIPALKSGRVTDSQLLMLLSSYRSYLPGVSYRPTVDALVRPGAGPAPLSWLHSRVGEGDGGRQKIVQPITQLITYKVYSPERGLIGRHFVVFRGWTSASTLTVVDPNNPTKLYTYDVVPFNDGIEQKFLLSRPDGKNKYKQVLDRVFTLAPVTR